VPILAGIVFLIVPGVLLALYWSQSVYVLIEDRAAWFDAAGESYQLTSGKLSLILIVWLLIGGLQAATGIAGVAMEHLTIDLGWPPLARDIGPLAAKIAADASGILGLASLYHVVTSE
jgi:hypothetical protein